MVALRTIKQLNKPQPISVRAGRTGEPEQVRIRTIKDPSDAHRQRRQTPQAHKLRGIRSDGQWMQVAHIEDRWKIRDEWWRGTELEIERLYFDVVLESNQRLTLFHDLVTHEWFRQSE